MSLIDRIRGALPVTRSALTAIEGENHTLRARLKAAKESGGIASGVDINWGSFEYEYNSALTGASRWATLDKIEADPHVKGALKAQTLPLINAEWEMTPASEDARDVEIAEFCSANLLRTQGDKYGREYWTETPWAAQRLPEILQMLRDGFAMFHKTTRVVGTKRVFDRIQWIEPASIDTREGWVTDTRDNFVGIKRTYESPDGRFVQGEEIPASDLALYVWDLKGGRLEGRPFIRSMYGAWFRKEFVQRMRTIWAQKVGAPMPVGHYPHDWTDSGEIDDFIKAVKSARGTSPGEAFGVFKKGVNGEKAEIDFAGAPLNVERGMNKLIDSENAEIAHGGGTKSDLLGETGSGSRAVGEVQQRNEAPQTEAVAAIVCEWENHGVGNLPGIVEKLVEMNFAGTKQYPSLVCTGVVPKDEPSTDEIVKAWTAGIIPHTPDAKRQLVARYGLELPDEAYEIQEPPPLPTVPPSKPGEEPNEPSDTEDEEEAQQVAAAARDRFVDRMAHLLAPATEGAPTKGGRFPVEVGGEAARSAEDRQGEPRGRARHSHRATGGA